MEIGEIEGRRGNGQRKIKAPFLHFYPYGIKLMGEVEKNRVRLFVFFCLFSSFLFSFFLTVWDRQ